MKKILIVFAGVVFLLSGCAGFDKKNTQKMPMIDPSNKVSESFFAKTKLTKNFTKEKSESGDISINKLEIVDDRTLLNGMALFSEENLENVKIKILPCNETPFKSSEDVLGDCFEINPGTTYNQSDTDYLVFPQKLIEGIDDINFGFSNEEGGAQLWHFVDSKGCFDCPPGGLYSGNYIYNDSRYSYLFNPDGKKIFHKKSCYSWYMYFSGYYYFGYEDRTLTQRIKMNILKRIEKFL